MKKAVLVFASLLLLFGICVLPQVVSAQDECLVGEVTMFAGSFLPSDWEFCDGQWFPVSVYPDLDSVLGGIYGRGEDASGNPIFKLPDLRGRAAIHEGIGDGLTNRSLGASGGSETETLSTDHIPVHNHDLMGSPNIADSTSPSGKLPGTTSRSRLYSSSAGGSNLAMDMDAVSEEGQGNPHNNMQPYHVLNFIICARGIVPPSSCEEDYDKDGYGNGPSCIDSDCDDTNPNIHPGVNDSCNGIDDDCDEQIDEDFSPNTQCQNWGDCVAGENICSRWGVRTRTCRRTVCRDGSLEWEDPYEQTEQCLRSPFEVPSDGAPCGEVECWSWGTCGNFEDTCDQTGVRSRTCQSARCFQEVCRPFTFRQEDECTRNTNGQSCGTDSRCIDGECVNIEL